MVRGSRFARFRSRSALAWALAIEATGVAAETNCTA
jgi:hypothetical protein